MTTKSRLYLGVAALAIAVVLTGSVVEVSAQQSAPAAVAIDNDDIGGVVTGANGPEAGVWVIAETTDLPTRYAKMVVTDDQGRYVVPDLPKAKYKVWVRGYGLVDSAKVDGEPGKQLNLTAVAAPNEAEAAKYYPAIYWYSMLKIPDASQFGKKDGDIPDKVKQSDWLNLMKNNGCVGCHQLGQLSTRTFPPGLGEFSSHAEAWVRRTQAGQSGELMVNILAGQLAGAPIKYFADWTERVAKGELPKTKPTRPQGVERNVVVTTWDWGDPKKYLHDLIASDRRDPTVNAYGPLFGQPEYSTDVLPILDPKTHTVTNFKAPVRDADTPEGLGPGHAAMAKPLGPSPYWGEEKLYDTKVNNHNAMFDQKGRVWLAAAVRGPKNPDFCKKGSDHPSAKLFPLEQTHRALAIIDPKTLKYTFVDTCFQTHHLQFAYDANNTLWTSQRRRRRRGRLGQHQDVRRDRRCGEVAGLDGAHPRHQRQRQARRVCRAQPAAGSGQGQAHRPGVLRGHAEPGRRIGLGDAARQPRLDRAARSRLQPAGNRAGGNLQRADAGLRPARRRYRQQGRGVGVARKRSYRQLRPEQVQGSAQRTEGDRRSLPGGLGVLPVSGAGLRRHRREQRRVRATTAGSTSTTRSASARMCRCPPPTSWTAWSPSRTARWSRCACRIRWASTPRASTAASTMPMPAGKAAGCGPAAATGRRG